MENKQYVFRSSEHLFDDIVISSELTALASLTMCKALARTYGGKVECRITYDNDSMEYLHYQGDFKYYKKALGKFEKMLKDAKKQLKKL